jgi:hypothetical protein
MKNLVLIGLALSVVGCSKPSQQQNPQPVTRPEATSSSGATPQPGANVPKTEATAPGGGQGVKTEMRNVLFHLTTKAAAHIDTLSGELWPAGKNDMPIFDDKTSFEVRVANGKIWITTDALAEIMNRYVFAAKDAPLKDLSISIKDQKLDIKGKLHTKGDIPFETSGTVTLNDDGRLRVHTEKVKALHVPVKGMMGLLGIELAAVVNTSKIDGLDTDKNDLLMDLGGLLPPPHIRGKVTGVAVEGNRIVTTFGDGGKGAGLPGSQERVKNYMSFQGNRVRFGKLTMENTDLLLLDLDPADPLDWNQDRYKDQLVAGYSKINNAFGLRSYVKDFAKLPRAGAPQPDTVPKD